MGTMASFPKPFTMVEFTSSFWIYMTVAGDHLARNWNPASAGIQRPPGHACAVKNTCASSESPAPPPAFLRFYFGANCEKMVSRSESHVHHTKNIGKDCTKLDRIPTPELFRMATGRQEKRDICPKGSGQAC